jgi:putative YphP/YqiW family bacilliredoxin
MTTEKRPPLSITGDPAARPARPTMYDERFIAPMRRELTELGFQELQSADEVDAELPNAKGTALLVVNSMCGCAARNARPAVREALAGGGPRPAHLFTVFAGQDPEPTSRARDYLTGYAPSSPSMGLLKDGELVWMMERWQIEGRPAPDIAADIAAAFGRYCSP